LGKLIPDGTSMRAAPIFLNLRPQSERSCGRTQVRQDFETATMVGLLTALNQRELMREKRFGVAFRRTTLHAPQPRKSEERL
jgi:hypothetical protein